MVYRKFRTFLRFGISRLRILMNPHGSFTENCNEILELQLLLSVTVVVSPELSTILFPAQFFETILNNIF